MDRVTDPADPNRCKGSGREGQCMNHAEPGDEYCRKCGGTDLAEVENVRQYHLTDARLRQRLDKKAGHDQIKSLTEEIGLTRLLIEELMNSCKTDTQRLANVSTYNTLTMNLERLIKTSHTMEQSLNLLLAKPALVAFAQEMIRIIADELRGTDQYEEKIDRITSRMLDNIEHAANKLEKE